MSPDELKSLHGPFVDRVKASTLSHSAKMICIELSELSFLQGRAEVCVFVRELSVLTGYAMDAVGDRLAELIHAEILSRRGRNGMPRIYGLLPWAELPTWQGSDFDPAKAAALRAEILSRDFLQPPNARRSENDQK